jgi:hypothetical protein
MSSLHTYPKPHYCPAGVRWSILRALFIVIELVNFTIDQSSMTNENHQKLNGSGVKVRIKAVDAILALNVLNAVGSLHFFSPLLKRYSPT